MEIWCRRLVTSTPIHHKDARVVAAFLAAKPRGMLAGGDLQRACGRAPLQQDPSSSHDDRCAQRRPAAGPDAVRPRAIREGLLLREPQRAGRVRRPAGIAADFAAGECRRPAGRAGRRRVGAHAGRQGAGRDAGAVRLRAHLCRHLPHHRRAGRAHDGGGDDRVPASALPFARQIVADAVRNGGFPPLYIDPVDFVALFQQRMAQMEQGGAPAPLS